MAGHSIYVPIAQILPSVTTWGTFNWNWTYLDTLVQTAVSHNKKFSIALEMGFQNSFAYLNSLPAGFAAACGADCAPLFRSWSVGGKADQCIEGYVPLPWVPNVQQFWSALATAMAQHLQQTGTYSSLTLVHLPGVSIYDEEFRLPSGLPGPTSSDSTTCPDGTAAYPNVQNDASQARWQTLGYSDANVVSGFTVIAKAYAQAFPDKFLGVSLLNPGASGVDFPRFTNDPVGYVASLLVQAALGIAPGRIQLQSDDLDVSTSETAVGEVIDFANQFSTAVGWQMNKHGGTGAACNSQPCTPDGADSGYFQLLETGAINNGEYIEVFSADVVAYPLSYAASQTAGYYPITAASAPVITIEANNSGYSPQIAPNTWVYLKGERLAPAGIERPWQASDFVNGQMPTELNGVSATVNGKSAFVYYVSPGQVNILTPSDALSGVVKIQLANNGATSAAVVAEGQPTSPSFFVFGAGPYVLAQHADGSLLGPATLYPGATTPAKPGETVVLYANGFGSTSVPVVDGASAQSGTLSPLPVVTVGGIAATVAYAGLPGPPGEFQFNVVIPASISNGDQPISATYGGVSTQSGTLITIQK
ncbi:MAG: hypothetical protein ACLQVN_18755 [Bryobacteraceae bacterium]